MLALSLACIHYKFSRALVAPYKSTNKGKGMCVSSILQHNFVIPFSLVFETCLILFFAEDFFKDLQEEFRNWEANAASEGKPKSLWEELAVRLPV